MTESSLIRGPPLLYCIFSLLLLGIRLMLLFYRNLLLDDERWSLWWYSLINKWCSTIVQWCTIPSHKTGKWLVNSLITRIICVIVIYPTSSRRYPCGQFHPTQITMIIDNDSSRSPRLFHLMNTKVNHPINLIAALSSINPSTKITCAGNKEVDKQAIWFI